MRIAEQPYQYAQNRQNENGLILSCALAACDRRAGNYYYLEGRMLFLTKVN